METPKAAVVKIGKGKQTHLALNAARPVAFCKGLRVHRAILIAHDLSRITCEKCKTKSRNL